MRKYFNIIVLPVVLIAILFLYSIINLSGLPPQIVIHFDSAGNPNGFMSSSMFPIIMTFLPLLCVSFITLLEYGIFRNRYNEFSFSQTIIIILKYLFIGAFLIITFELIRYNSHNEIISTSQILFGAVIIAILSVTLVFLIQRKRC